MKIKNKFFVPLLTALLLAGATVPANAEVYKYYNKLNSTQKKAYKEIEKKLESASSGKLSVILKCKYSEAILSIEAITADRPDLFGGNITIGFESDGKKTKYTFLDINGKSLSKKLRNIINKQDLRGTDNFETVKNIHDWIIKYLEYDFSSDDTLTDKYSMKGALLNKKAVCEGYARTFKYLCDKYKIPCALVVGNSNNPSTTTTNERHMWNYVKLDDEWYAVDTTWNDNLSTDNHICYDYFLVGSNTKDSQDIPFSKSHLRFQSFLNFDIKEVKKGFKYPTLSDESFFGKDSNIYEYLKANYSETPTP